MKLVVFGTGPFCVPSLAALHKSRHQILAVVTRPIDEPGKRRKSAANPVGDFAAGHDLQIWSPHHCNDPVFIESLQSHNIDLLFVCDYGQILSSACLSAARLGGINLHGSLLPLYRGAAPVQWAIYHGQSETGATVIHMTPRLDGGPILSVVKTAIESSETAPSLEARLSQLGVLAVQQALEMLDGWDGQTPIGTPQDITLATTAPRLTKQDGKIDWRKSAQQIVNQVRAFQPWPGSYCYWHSSTPPARWIIHQAYVADINSDAAPGTIVAVDDRLLAIQTGSHALAINQIQTDGKRPMPIADFLRGHSPKIGQQVD